MATSFRSSANVRDQSEKLRVQVTIQRVQVICGETRLKGMSVVFFRGTDVPGLGECRSQEKLIGGGRRLLDSLLQI